MSGDKEDRGVVKRYLLGELTDQERERFEVLMMSDTELFNEMLLVEEDLVEAYVNRTMSRNDRQTFEHSYMSTVEGREQVSFARALGKYVKSRAASPAHSATPGKARQPIFSRVTWFSQLGRSPYLRPAAAAVILLAAGLGIWRVFFYQSDVSKGIAVLAYAFRDQRPVEARISGFNYAPAATTRGDEEKVDRVARNRAERILLDEASEHPSAASHHALGRLYLAEGKFADAITEFDEVLKTDANNAELHSDYGAALLEYGRTVQAGDEGGRADESFAQSLNHLNRTLALNPNLHEALFNRALLREQMKLIEAALEDWREYLEKDPSSPWAEEAREHLTRLEERQRKIGENQQNIVEDFLSAVRASDAERAWELLSTNREKIVAAMLEAYLRSAGGQVPRSDRESLDALTYAGERDARRTGDNYVLDLAGFYRSASMRQLMAAGEGTEFMRKARNAYGKADVEGAADLRARARDVFSKIGDRCNSQLATYWLALHFWELGRTQQSLSLFEPLLRECDADGHRWLRARSLHQRAGIAFKFGEYSTAIAYETDARQMAEKLNDPSLASSARSAVIEHYRLLGNQAACFNQMADGRKLLGEPTLSLLALWRQYDTLATAFYAFGYYDAAIDHEREAMNFAAHAGDFVTSSYCQAHLGLIYGKAERYDEAFNTLEEAYRAASSHADQSLGQLMMAYAAVQKGHLNRERGEFRQALNQYDQAIALHKNYALDFPTHLYQAYKGRLACCIALNDTSAAQQQLVTLLEIMDEHRAKIVEEDNRDNFFDVEQSVYDMGIDLAYSRMGREEQSFTYAEDSRGRSLLDSIQGNAKAVERGGKLSMLLRVAAKPLSLGEIQAHLPQQTRLLEYAVLDDKLLIWVISPNRFLCVAVPVAQADLTETVRQFLAALRDTSERKATETDRLARKLFGYLIAPIAELINGCRTVVVVPDKVLNRLPWDALVSPKARFLVEDYLVTIAPSATLFALCSDRAAQKDDGRVERVLSVGNPSFDRRAFPQLQNLEDAQDEATKIRDLYSDSSPLLIGPAAREQSVREELTRADVAHFALHCEINERFPMRSSLLMSKEAANGTDLPEMDGLLRAYEICGFQLKRTRLVVLSACQTGVEHYYRGEGMIGMARAFLVAQVPLVVGSLWPTDSAATAKLMVLFHKYRKLERQSTAEALRSAKLTLLRSDSRHNEPYYWAAFQVIGGRASF